MSSRPILTPNSVTPLINAVSTGANITGPATIIQMLAGISYDISWTGTTTGTLSVEVSTPTDKTLTVL
jgi:hypothetical protein